MPRAGLFEHRKFKRLARAIGNKAVAAGSLELIWHSCYATATDYIGDAMDVEAAADWKGKTGKLCDALLDAGGEEEPGFIERVPGRSGYRVHDLLDHAPEHVRRKFERERAREESGRTLAEDRSEAGKRGRAAQLERASGEQEEDNRRTSDSHLPASGEQLAGKTGTSGGVGVGGGGLGEKKHPPENPGGNLPRDGDATTRRGRPPAKLAFTIADACAVLAVGAIIDPFPREPKYPAQLTKLIKLYPSLATWRKVGHWLAEGGDDWGGGFRGDKPTLDVVISKFGAWVQRLEADGFTLRPIDDPDAKPVIPPSDTAGNAQLVAFLDDAIAKAGTRGN